MKVAHLSGRFVGALWPGPPRAEPTSRGSSRCSPRRASRSCRRQPNHDRATRSASPATCRRGSPAPSTPTIRAGSPAALLHDIGKLDARLGVYGRVVATMSGAAAGREHRRARGRRRAASPAGSASTCATPSSAPTASASRGEPEEAALWAAAHHDPGTLGLAADPGAGDRRPRRRRQRLTPVAGRRSDARLSRTERAQNSAASFGVTKRPMAHSSGKMSSQTSSARSTSR